MAVIGFASVLFTYLGVNYLPGLHSYLQGMNFPIPDG